MIAEESEALFRLRKEIVRNIVTSMCLLSVPVFAQIPDTSNLPIRSLHTHNEEPFIRLASEVIPPTVFKVGDGISPPKPIFSPDPEYSEEARRANYQGTVVLGIIVETDGRPYGVKVLRNLKYGLDEKAIAAVKKWRFHPALKDGKPVAVYITVEVNFRLWPGRVTPVPVENEASVDMNPSGAQDSAKPPVIPQSGRIQNIVPEEMWERVTQCVFPIFPQLVESAHITGTVDIGLGISPAGEVGNYRVLRSDHPLLVQPALDAIRQWKFHPNVVQGEVTWSRIRALVRFNADGMTAIDLEHAILADNFGDPGTPASADAGSAASTSVAVPRPESAPACTVNASVDMNPAAAPSRPAGATKSSNCQGLVKPPVPTYTPDPELPRQKTPKDPVDIELLVATDGKTNDLKVVRSVDEPFDQAALKAVQKWRFNPATCDGVPMATHIYVSVEFRSY